MTCNCKSSAPGADASPMNTLIQLSHCFGSNPEFVLAGGGNTSAKIGDKLYVKGSGHPLATITAEGFVEMSRAALDAILTTELAQGPRGARRAV